MTKKQFEKIAKILNEFNKRNETEGFNPTQFLLDEFCYILEEENKLFNEVKFRQAVLEI